MTDDKLRAALDTPHRPRPKDKLLGYSICNVCGRVVMTVGNGRTRRWIHR